MKQPGRVDGFGVATADEPVRLRGWAVLGAGYANHRRTLHHQYPQWIGIAPIRYYEGVQEWVYIHNIAQCIYKCNTQYRNIALFKGIFYSHMYIHM
jgi:hypothetical protein